MYCRFCGKKLEDDWKFCPMCGNPVDGSESLSRENFEKKIKEIEKRLFSQRYIIYAVILEDNCVREYTDTLISCNMNSVKYIAAVHKDHYITVGGNNGYTYHLLGFYNKNYEQIDAIPAPDNLELYDFGYGEWYQMKYWFRDKDTRAKVGTAYKNNTLEIMIKEFRRTSSTQQ